MLAEQISGLEDPRALPPREQLLLRQRALGLGGAVGYQPIIMFLQPGTNFNATAVISADRRYVRITSVPSFSHDQQRDDVYVCRGAVTAAAAVAVAAAWAVAAAAAF